MTVQLKKNVVDLLCEKDPETIYNFLSLYVPENQNNSGKGRPWGFPLEEKIFRDLYPHFIVGRDDTYLEYFTYALPRSTPANRQKIIDIGSRIFNESIKEGDSQKVTNMIELFGGTNTNYWNYLKLDYGQLLEYAKNIPKDAVCEIEWFGTRSFYTKLFRFIQFIQEKFPLKYKKEYRRVYRV